MLPLREEVKALILGLILWIPVGLPLVLPIIFCFLFVYPVARLLVKIFAPELIPISKCDSFCAFAPSNTPSSYMYTCQIWRVKGTLDVDAFRNHFYQCFLSTEEDRKKYQNLYCHFVQKFGYIFKKKVKQIDLQWHIHEHCLEEGSSVEGFAGQWMMSHDSGPNDKTERPVWMVKVIPIDNGVTKETFILFKLHHGICDGYTIVHLVDKLSGQKSPYLFKDPEPSLLKKLKCFVAFPYHTISVWLKMSISRRKKMRFVDEETRSKDHEEKWLISLFTMDLDAVKGIRRATGTNFVTVLMSVQIGALRRFLKEANPPNAKRLLNQVPMETFLGHSMGWPNHPVPINGGGMTNHLTINAIKASFHLEDPLERLLDLDKYFRDSKSQGHPINLYYSFFNGMKYFPSAFLRFLAKWELGVFSMETGLSSLLGSPNKHFLLGHPVENIWLPVLTTSLDPALKLMTVPVSHSGILDISVNAGSSLVKNQELLDRLTKVHFVGELEALRLRCQQLVE